MRRIVLIGAALISVALAVLWHSTTLRETAEPYTPRGQGEVYLALGDSLAAGFTVSSPAEAYVARIAADLRRAGPIEVRNLAVPGETSRSFLRRQLPQAVEYIRVQRAAGKRVSPITIDIGGNDARAAAGAPAEMRREMIATIEKNIGSALDQLIAATTTSGGQRGADIAVMTYYNPYPGNARDETTLAYWTAELNAAITRAAQARGVAVADVASAFEGGKVYRYTYIATGDIHANADGHRLIAERFLAALQYNHSP